MIDPDLAALAEKATRGEECPPVCLTLTSGALVVGNPGRGDVFGDEAITAIQQEAWDALAMDGRKRRGREDHIQVTRDATAGVKAACQELQDRPATEGVLLLAPAQWYPPMGDGLSIPVMRVALDHVVGWWVGPTASVIQTTQLGGGGGMFFGVGGLFPMGD